MSMEDACLVVPDFEHRVSSVATRRAAGIRQLALFGVFDGHGGRCVSRWAVKHLPRVFREKLALPSFAGKIRTALPATFLELDALLCSVHTVADLKRLDMIGEKEEDRIRSQEQEEDDDDDDDAGSISSSGTSVDQIPDMQEILTAVHSAVEGGDEGHVDEGDESNASAEVPSDSSSSEEAGSNFCSKTHPAYDCGCTAVAAVIDLTAKTLTVANAGDSRCVISRGGVAVPMSQDHKPTDEVELNRIKKAGGVVTAEGRVDGNLNLSRALGDFNFKQNKQLKPSEQKISCVPDIREVQLTSTDDFMLLACDGIWEVMSCQQAVSFVREKLSAISEAERTSDDLSMICGQLCDECMSSNPDETDCYGCDNMTVLLVLLPKLFQEEQNTQQPAVLESGRAQKKRPREFQLRPRKIQKQ